MSSIDKEDRKSWSPKVSEALDVPAFNYGVCMVGCNCLKIASIKAGRGFISQYVCLGDRKKSVINIDEEE